MIEILGGEGLELALEELGLSATQNWSNGMYEVWEMRDSDFSKLYSIPDEEWKEEWGWWRYGHCILEGSASRVYIVNGHKMLGYEPKIKIDNLDNSEDKEIEKEYWGYKFTKDFSTYTEWLHEIMNLGNLKHTACFAVSLAKENGMSLSDFMERFQPII